MTDWLVPLNNLVGGLFLLSAFALVATRQMRGSLRFFIYQSLCLVLSAVLIGLATGIRELYVIAAINLISKPIVIPWLLRRTVPEKIQTRREIELAITVPLALLIALAIATFSYFAGHIILDASPAKIPQTNNVPIGIAGLLIGAYTITVRREAVPQLLGLLSMENGAFFVGIAFAPDLPVIAEVAAAFDSLIIAVLVSLLTRAIHLRMGTTEVGALTVLKEERRK
jgi:hydrogenase-4 component E